MIRSRKKVFPSLFCFASYPTSIIDMPSETAVALEIIRRDLAHLPAFLGWPFVILQTQLYYFVSDRTQVDIELVLLSCCLFFFTSHFRMI